ncbi:MAG TPA: Gfo/Idh/MocA family oxidoreductase, partial [Longimicrobiales bacterium]|nr:Gfo/Idh/MocA family oxidoreductase [Longimicrobiales bacterium]
GGYERLLADSAVDAVYIPLPNSEHRPWAVRAAEAGKHVLCEKPLGLDEQECREMAEAASAHGVALMEAFMYRFHPRTERLVELVREGAVGDVLAIRSAFRFRLDNPDDIRLRPDLGGGALMDVGCYCVDVSRRLVGAEPVEVQAFAHWTDGGVDDRLTGTLHFESGVIARFDCAMTMEERQFVEVSGTEGHLAAPRAFRPRGADPVLVHRGDGGRETRDLHPRTDQYRLMVEHFAGCILEGRPVRYPPAAAGLGMRVIEALYRSAREGGRVEPVIRSRSRRL